MHTIYIIIATCICSTNTSAFTSVTCLHLNVWNCLQISVHKHTRIVKTNTYFTHPHIHVQEQMSRMYEHFEENRIETHVFASQWFLTLYTAKFPLSLVFRILDIYLCEVSNLDRIGSGLAWCRCIMSWLYSHGTNYIILFMQGIQVVFRVALGLLKVSPTLCSTCIHLHRFFCPLHVDCKS